MCNYFEGAYTMWKAVQTIGIFEEDDKIYIQEECFENQWNQPVHF